MEVTVSQEEQYYIIAVDGDLDASSSIMMDNALEEAFQNDNKYILIDCQKLHYISSPGIGVLTSRLDECEETGTQIALFGMSEKVLNVFQILGLDRLIPIKVTKEEAKNHLD